MVLLVCVAFCPVFWYPATFVPYLYKNFAGFSANTEPMTRVKSERISY